MKQIVILCDGTWHNKDKTRNPSNIWKLYHIIENNKINDNIVCYYQEGVGNRGNIFKRLYNAATGNDLDQHITEIYRWLVENYEEGDQLYLFGYSRGAYIARSLVGLIRNCGIVHKKTWLEDNINDLIKSALSIYRDRRHNWHPNSYNSIRWRNCISYSNINIKFLGVFDTVGSLGIPRISGTLYNIFNREKYFHDTELSTVVKNAYHILAVDERRKPFKPTLWKINHTTNIKQVWFSGSHSDVGGGATETNKDSLSDITLYNMLDEAIEKGLQIKNTALNNILQIESLLAPVHNSSKAIFRLPFFNRWRNLHIQEKNNYIHNTVKHRLDTLHNYNPKNIKPLKRKLSSYTIS